jgi:hypothetical protein
MSDAPQINTALDQLRHRANEAVIDKPPGRRPTWAPPLPLEGELLEIFHDLQRLRLEDFARWVAQKPDKRSGAKAPEADEPILRLWASFHDPRNTFRPDWAGSGVHDCNGFKLRFGVKPDGQLVFRAAKGFDGTWATGPCWAPGSERASLLIRACELGEQIVAPLVGDAADVRIAAASRTLGWCVRCCRALTDPVSIEAGIGPECITVVAKMEAASRPEVLQTAWRQRQQDGRAELAKAGGKAG